MEWKILKADHSLNHLSIKYFSETEKKLNGAMENKILCALILLSPTELIVPC